MQTMQKSQSYTEHEAESTPTLHSIFCIMEKLCIQYEPIHNYK